MFHIGFEFRSLSYHVLCFQPRQKDIEIKKESHSSRVGWAGLVMEKALQTCGQEQWRIKNYQHRKRKVISGRLIDRCRWCLLGKSANRLTDLQYLASYRVNYGKNKNRTTCLSMFSMREMWLRYQRCNPGCQDNRKKVITLTFSLTLFRRQS